MNFLLIRNYRVGDEEVGVDEIEIRMNRVDDKNAYRIVKVSYSKRVTKFYNNKQLLFGIKCKCLNLPLEAPNKYP